MDTKQTLPMKDLHPVDVVDGIGRFAPSGEYSLVDAVDLVSHAIAHCRDRGIDRLLIDVTGITGLPIPTLVERFLMAEDWAHESSSKVTVAMVTTAEYIHPQKFGSESGGALRTRLRRLHIRAGCAALADTWLEPRRLTLCVYKPQFSCVGSLERHDVPPASRRGPNRRGLSAFADPPNTAPSWRSVSSGWAPRELPAKACASVPFAGRRVASRKPCSPRGTGTTCGSRIWRRAPRPCSRLSMPRPSANGPPS